MTAPTVTEAVLNQVASDIHTTALDKGFWDPTDPFLGEVNTKLLLIVSEAIEAHDVLRKHYDDGPVNAYSRMTSYQGEEFIEELADIVIRTFDLARYFEGVHGNFAEIILAKMAKNANRPSMHGKRF